MDSVAEKAECFKRTRNTLGMNSSSTLHSNLGLYGDMLGYPAAFDHARIDVDADGEMSGSRTSRMAAITLDDGRQLRRRVESKVLALVVFNGSEGHT